MSADIPDTIAPRGNNLTPTDRMQALTTYLDKAIKENTEIMNVLQTRLAKVSSHFESSLPDQSRVQVDRMTMMSHDLNTISEALSRLDGRIEEEEEELRKREIEREKQKLREEKRAEKIKEMKLKIKISEENMKAVKVKGKTKVRKVKKVKVKKEEAKEVKVKMEMEDGKEDITTTAPTTATAATLAGTQLPALESGQDTLAPVPTAQEEEGPAGLSGQTGPEAKAQVEMDMDPGNERENGNQNTVTSPVTTAAQTETQIPLILTADHSSPGGPAVAASSTLLPITANKTDTTTTTGEITKTPWAETHQEALGAARRRSPRILESVQKSAQNIVAILTMQEDLTLTTTPGLPPSNKKTTPKSMSSSPILKPKLGAGVTKNKAPSRTPTPSQTPPKIKKQSPQVEEEKDKEEKEEEKEEEEEEDEKEENQNQIQNTTVAATTTTTTAKPRRGKTPGKAPRVPQRRSTRIMESTQKKAQAKLLPTIIQPESPILKPKDGAGVSKRGGKGRGGATRGGRGRGARGGQGK